MADVESSLSADGSATASAEVSSAAERAVTELRRVAASDADVMRLLDAYVAEATKKVDVMRVSGLTSKRYEAALLMAASHTFSRGMSARSMGQMAAPTWARPSSRP